MKTRNHKILDHPILGYFLLLIFVNILSSLGSKIDELIGRFLPGYTVETEFYGQIVSNSNGVGIALTALLALLIFKLWFKPDFSGCLQKSGLKIGILLLLPFLALHCLGSVVSWVTLGTGSFFIAFLRASAPGFSEEVMFRGLGVANYMRTIKSESQLKVIFWLSSIVFGLVHLSNILVGGDPLSCVIQAVYAIGVGMLFCAVYLRTGNLWPTIFGHWLVDFFEMSRADLSNSGGLMVGMGVGDWITIAAAAFGAVWGLYLMRSKYHGEIMEIWSKKWNKEGAAVK